MTLFELAWVKVCCFDLDYLVVVLVLGWPICILDEVAHVAIVIEYDTVLAVVCNFSLSSGHLDGHVVELVSVFTLKLRGKVCLHHLVHDDLLLVALLLGLLSWLWLWCMRHDWHRWLNWWNLLIARVPEVKVMDSCLAQIDDCVLDHG